MLKESDVKKFLDLQNYDLRISKNGRWIDQKCTPDVLNIVSDCVIQFYKQQEKVEFTSADIWHSTYAEENVRDIFNKPSTNAKLSKNEYDKFFAQPLEMLANAKILSKEKRGRQNKYLVKEIELLEFISLRERNALVFIYLYCEKVLLDSGIWHEFKNFFNNQTKESYENLKESYEDFIITNTPINGKTEVRRIFTKVLNPIANFYHKLGTSRGRLSKNPITYAELMYNRENFRDINKEKPKGITRKEWAATHPVQYNLSYYKYQSRKAKNFLRQYNDQYRDGRSELLDEFSNGDATQMHHIFPEAEFPSISMFIENLIALTPTQHLTKAHPKNKTQIVDPVYQELLLKAKLGSIEENINDNSVETIYSFQNLVIVLSTGFDLEFEIQDNEFQEIMNVITNYYIRKGN